MMNVPLLCSNWTAGSAIGWWVCSWAPVIGLRADDVAGSGVGSRLERVLPVAGRNESPALHLSAHALLHKHAPMLVMSNLPPTPQLFFKGVLLVSPSARALVSFNKLCNAPLLKG